MKPMQLSWLSLAVSTAVGAFAAPGVAQAAQVAYVNEQGQPFERAAYLIDWRQKNTRARLVGVDGVRTGQVSTVGLNQVITLDTPFTSTTYGEPAPCDGLQPEVRVDITQVAVRLRSGTVNKGLSAISQAGTATTLTGCEAGKVVPVGAISDTSGSPTLHRAMTALAPTTDLVPGVALAGLSAEGQSVSAALPVDVATIQSAGVLDFARAAVQVGYRVDPAGWYVLNLGSTGERGYLRLTAADGRGLEQWMVADFSGGQPVRVESAAVVKPVAGAAWGTVAETARMWSSGLFAKSRTPFYFYLYRKGHGERVYLDLDAGTETRDPIRAWRIAPEGWLEQTRDVGNSGWVRQRYWTPVARAGKTMVVIESEQVLPVNQAPYWLIPPRINWYQDTGKAVPPAVASTTAKGESLNAAQTLR